MFPPVISSTGKIAFMFCRRDTLLSFSKFKKNMRSFERLVATPVCTWYQNYNVAQYVSLFSVCLFELISCREAVKVELFSSYSPCVKCCKLIEQFLHHRPQCKICIAFTCVYRDNDQQHRSALSGLRKNASVIRLDVFRENDWVVLQEMGLVTLTPVQYIAMRHWDEYWRNKLDDVLGWCRVVEALLVCHVWIINEVFYSRYVCDVIRSGRQAPAFRMNFLPSSLG